MVSRREHRTPGAARPSRGFTLVEVMIAMVILAILAMIAVPGYFDQVRRSRRADAIAALTRVQHAQERWRSNNPTYTATLGAGGLNLGAGSQSGYYALTLTAASASAGTTYVVSATASGSQASDQLCAVMRVTVSGGDIVYASGSDASASNNAADNKRCWNQ